MELPCYCATVPVQVNQTLIASLALLSDIQEEDKLVLLDDVPKENTFFNINMKVLSK